MRGGENQGAKGGGKPFTTGELLLEGKAGFTSIFAAYRPANHKMENA